MEGERAVEPHQAEFRRDPSEHGETILRNKGTSSQVLGQTDDGRGRGVVFLIAPGYSTANT